MLLRFASRVLLVCLAVLLPVGCSSTATSGSTATVEESQLPAEARQTIALIDQGGPFPYAKGRVVN